MEDNMHFMDKFFEDCLKDFNVPEGWVNISYKNDVCPSFYYKGYQIFVNHPDPKEREIEDSFRFAVIIDYEYAYTGWTFCAETIEEVLPELEVPYLSRPLVHDKEEYLRHERDMGDTWRASS